jgi:hypothetical protein
MVAHMRVVRVVRGRACFNALLGEKHQVQLARNLSPANNRPLDCRLANAQPARRLRSTHSQFLYRIGLARFNSGSTNTDKPNHTRQAHADPPWKPHQLIQDAAIFSSHPSPILVDQTKEMISSMLK